MALVPTTSRLDASLLDAFLLDGVTASPPGPPSSTDLIQFNSYGLQNANIVTTQVTYSGPQRDLGEAAYPRAHGEFMQTDYWRRTVITLRGYLVSTSQTALETLMDTLRQNLATGNANLLVTWAGASRIWNAYCIMEKIFDQRQGYHINWCPFEISFIEIQPFGRAANLSSNVPPTPCTVNPTTYSFSNAGSAPTDSYWSLAINTAGSCNSIVLTNTTTGEAITIAHAFSNSDALIIDGLNKVVTLNGTAVDYTGIFPTMAAGINVFTLAPNGAGFSIQPTETHYPQYF